MQLKEAISAAKIYVAEAFSDEIVNGVRLEEIEYKEDAREWLITLGLYRPIVTSGAATPTFLHAPSKKSYKVVRISDEGGKVISIRNRESSED